MKRVNYSRLLVFVLVVAVLLRFALALMTQPSGDGAWHLSSARFIERNLAIPFDEPTGRAEPFWPAPLFHVVAAFFYFLFGDVGMMLVSPLFGSLSLLLTFLIVRKLYNLEIAFFSVLFLSFVPIHLYHSALPLIEAMTAFFVLLVVYLLLEGRLLLSSVSFGLLLLTKPTAIFLFPLVVFMLYQGCRSGFLKRCFVFFSVAFVVSFPWYLRNILLFGNPVWPYLNGLFGGLPAVRFGYPVSQLNLAYLFDLPHVFSVMYLEVFGVPNGDASLFSFLNIPFLNVLLLLWFVATVLFSLPFVFGLPALRPFKKKETLLLLFWVVPFLFFMAAMIVHWSGIFTRYLLPVFPAVGVVWALGFVELKKRVPVRLLLVLFLFCSAGFVAAEFVKAGTASRSWAVYQADFDWVKANVNPGDSVWLFWNGSQTFGYVLDRNIRFFNNSSNITDGFVFLNQDFRLDLIRAPDDVYDGVVSGKRFKLVYRNPMTATEVYRVE